MKFFIDTANIEEIKKANELGLLDGVTTNPSLISKEGREFKELIIEICGIVNGPVSAEVISTDAKGMIKEISGGVEADIFRKWMTSFKDENMYRIAHICYGYNPGARITGNIAEVERVFGVVQVGWGTQGPLIRPDLGGKPGWRAAAHCDGIMLNPNVYLDGEIIEEKGKYVHPELAKLVKEL